MINSMNVRNPFRLGKEPALFHGFGAFFNRAPTIRSDCGDNVGDFPASALVASLYGETTLLYQWNSAKGRRRGALRRDRSPRIIRANPLSGLRRNDPAVKRAADLHQPFRRQSA